MNIARIAVLGQLMALCLLVFPFPIAAGEHSARAPWIRTAEERAAVVRAQVVDDRAPRPATKTTPVAARPTDAALSRIRADLAGLKAALAALPADEHGLPPADAAIYAEAVERQLENDTWPTPEYEANTLTCLQWGLAVAAGLKADPALMRTVRHVAPLGYRSKVDRSAQPYVIILPEDYDPAAGKTYRLVVNLHGYYRYACAIATIAGFPTREKERNAGAITVNPFGRANNWFAWSAETDVWDVIADVKRRYPIDDNQIVLTGFSMGGGGTVNLALTHPGAFAAAAPQAAAIFDLDPMPKASDLPAGPARWAPLAENEIAARVARTYAGPALAENARGLPWLMGCGGADNLLRAQESLGRIFDTLSIPYSAYVVPKVGHGAGPVAAHPAYRPFLLAHVRDPAPRDVTFVTASLKSSGRAWVRVEALTAHYSKASIHAVANPEHGVLTVTTDGIERFSLSPPESLAPPGRTAVIIDGEQITGAATRLAFEKTAGRWVAATTAMPTLTKRPGLQGPVADAFTRGFLCVRPTGTPWNEASHNHALALLAGLRRLWNDQLFGELPVKADTEVTADDRANYDLILFGDPGSNRLIAEVLAAKSPWSLPLRWAQDVIALHTESFPAATHLPALIYPSPFSNGRYVVFNGVPLTRTRRPASDSNAAQDELQRVLPPVLGDFAILQVDPATAGRQPAKPIYAGFFDEQWR